LPEKKYRVANQAKAGGRGLYATDAIRHDEIIYHFRPELHPSATRTSVQVGPGKHAEGENEANSFLNHHCAPNVYIDTKGLCARALRDIEAGEELTFNYLTTEAELHSPFDCTCGAEHCFGHIAGFRHLSESERDRLRGSLAPHLLAEMEGVPAR